MQRSRFLFSSAPFYAPPDGPGGGAPAAGAPAAEVPIAAPAVEPAAAAAAPVADVAAPAPAADAGKPAADAPAPAADAPQPAADAKAAPVKDFAPSLLDEAVKPTAEAKPAEAKAGDKPADAAAADAKPSDKKEPAAADAKPADAKADEKKPAEAKAADAKPAEPPAPIKYEFKFPEGVKAEDLNPEQMDAFSGILNEVRVPPEKAQALLDMHLGEIQRISKEVGEQVAERQWNVFNEQQRKSREEVMADPELGGARHDTAIKTVMSVLDAFSLRDQTSKNPRSSDVISAERKQILDDFRATGIANRASLLRLLNWVGETYVKEGKPHLPGPPRGGNQNPQNRGLRRYSGTTPANAG